MPHVATKLTKPVLPLLSVVQGVRHLLKERLHLVLPTLSAGMHQVQPQDVGLQSVGNAEGLVGQPAEETLIDVVPEVLQCGEVRAVNALEDVLHNAIHLQKDMSTDNLLSRVPSPTHGTVTPIESAVTAAATVGQQSKLLRNTTKTWSKVRLGGGEGGGGGGGGGGGSRQ